MTVLAHKGESGPNVDRKQAVIYHGPFSRITDDEGNVYPRGQRIAVCDRTSRRLQQAPYVGLFTAIVPRSEVPLAEAPKFSSCRTPVRSPAETKGEGYDATSGGSSCC
jgi:hypothetical protein